MGDFGHIKTAVKCELFKQYSCSYYGAPLRDLQSKNVGNICMARRSDSYGEWHLLHTAMLSRCCLIVCHYWSTLKQRFIKFIHKALNHESLVINSVAKLSIQNPWSNCGDNYCHIRYEYHMHKDVSAGDIGRV